MKSVFISYAHQDSQAAQELRASLQDAKISGWMDKADIASGEDVAQRVKELIRGANVIVILVSPRSVGSPWVQFEVGMALTLGKRIIPVLIGDTNIERGLPDWLQEYAFIDARQRPIQEVALEVARAVSNE